MAHARVFEHDQPELPAGIGIAILDRKAVVVSANKTWHDFRDGSGANPAIAAVGESYLDAVAYTQPSARQITAAVRAAIAGKLVTPITVNVPGGTETEPRWYELSTASRVGEDGRIIGATLTVASVDHGENRAAHVNDNEWIAARLEEHVLQDLYAAGIGLQAVLTALTNEPEAARLHGDVAALDAAMRQVYALIFMLRHW